MTEPYRLTYTQACEKFKSGTLTVESYAQSLLSRISARDPIIHAWAYLNPDLILRRARELDQIPPEKRGPLHGMAIGVKDVILTKDMPTQHNSPIYEGDAPRIDAASIMTLRANGALIFGKTTTTEFAATSTGPPYNTPETQHKTSNPHDPSRTPGGSSSGSGAAVGDYQVPIALGTQTVGSTIRPGSFNGIYAMKPTWNAISREGQKLYSLIFDTLGLYARCVEDLKCLLDAFHVLDDEEETESKPDEQFTLKGSTFALLTLPTPEWPSPGPGTTSALSKATQILRSHGAVVEEITLPDEFKQMYTYHLEVLSGDGRVAFLPDYTISKESIDASLISHVENTQKYTRKQQLLAFDALAAMRPKMDALASRYTAILCPSALDEAPVGHANTGSAAFCGVWTAMHMPVVNVPGFMGENGLPVGVSVVAGRYRDQCLLRVVREVGSLFEEEGGWVRKV